MKTGIAPRTGRSELVRETSAQLTNTSSDTPLRSLRQLLQKPSKPTQSGRLSGRRAFDFDLRRPVKPRWPNADSEAWVNRQGRRFSRTGPWMAHCGGPRFRMCGRVHRATARCQVMGQERFAYFCALSKVSRRKGGTNFSHIPNNGYIPRSELTPPNPPCSPTHLVSGALQRVKRETGTPYPYGKSGAAPATVSERSITATVHTHGKAMLSGLSQEPPRKPGDRPEKIR